MNARQFNAELVRGEAVLSFPYDERLRQLLRAIPGRRWDPLARAWCVPLAPEQAATLARLIAAVAGEAGVSEALARALRKQRARRNPRECVVELARPDHDWWLSFATDGAPAAVSALLAHPDARSLDAIERALVPLDGRAFEIVRDLHARGRRELRFSPGAQRALVELGREREGGREVGAGAGGTREPNAGSGAHGVDRVWRGTVDVGGAPHAPTFVLLGDDDALPRELLAGAQAVPGGVAVPLAVATLEHVERLRAWMTEAARRCAAALRDGRPAPPAVLEISHEHEQPTFTLAPGHDPSCQERFCALPGAIAPERPRRARRFARSGGRLPAIRADPFCVAELDRFLSAEGVWIEPSALALLQELREQHARAAGIVERSAARDADLRVPALGGELKPFQRAGVAYLLAQRHAFLADEQGLGKTIEALAAIEADGAYPAVVVCPASLKLNWLREIERWLPHRSARALAGQGTRGSPPAADVTVVNYDILGARTAELEAHGPRALVIDESHYCKNAHAKRTQAVTRIAGAVDRDGLVLALTGTPVVNRPAELIPQLRILGRLADFGSGARFGERFQGPDAHARLHWHLRARCMVRRLKADVLPQLPAKTRAVVPVELDNEAEYRLAERDVVAWLQTQPLDLRELDARVAAALRAERLVRLNALKLLAARGKLHAAMTWIHDFRASGEPLVVFARHREIQRALLAQFPGALHILGSDTASARDRALRAFQGGADGHQGLVVCSIEVAGQGLTLTRSSNVAFLELDWTPAKHDQAEDRCHRIGQQDAVTAYYLLAAHTVDESIATLLERKRAVIGAVTDGRDDEEEGVVDALVRELRGAPYRHLRAVA